MQHLDLLVAQGIGLERGRRLHPHQRDELQQVILEHISQDAHAVIVAGAMPYAHGLGDRDLHVIDVVAVPERLEDRVGKAGHQDILDCLFAQVMVDAIDLMLVQDLVQFIVQFACRGQVGAEGLLDHDSPPALVLLQLTGRRRARSMMLVKRPGGVAI